MTAKGRILVLDDDRLVLATVTNGLAQAGYEVIDADNGDDAILLARERKPDLALLDIRMEGKTGFDVAEYLRDVCHIPFMFLSAFADEQTIAQVHALGAVAYMIKPLDVAQIVPTVDNAFARLREGTLKAGPRVPAAASAPVTAQPAASALGKGTPLSDPVPIAIGVLMHRYSLSRQVAWQRLQKLAADQQITLAVQAERLLLAMEELARSASS
jgi:two-component system, response regulator PdtaR